MPVEVIEQRTVGPTLGAAAIEASAKAAVIGVALTALFIIVVYRLLGGLADGRPRQLRPDLLRDAGRASARR